MLILAPIHDEISDSSSDEMEIDSVIYDANGIAIGETRRRRPPLANADYGISESNSRLIQNIGYDPHATLPARETRGPAPRSDLYNTASEINQVAGRMSVGVAERMGTNRTGDVPVRPTQDTARPSYMTGLHDMRSVGDRAGERGQAQQTSTHRREQTEVRARSEHHTPHVALRTIYGLYDKITKGLRPDKADTSLKLASATDLAKLPTSRRVYDTNRGKASSRAQPPPPDASARDTFVVQSIGDHVSLQRPSLELPVQGYGSVIVAGEWNLNVTTIYDRLEHELNEVAVAEMQLHKGELTMRYAHPRHPVAVDGLVRQMVNTSSYAQRFGHQQTNHGYTGPAESDALIRPGLSTSAHEQRFGHAPINTGPIYPIYSDGVIREGLDVSSMVQRFGQVTPTIGPLQPVGFEGVTREPVDVSAHEQRFGQAQTAAGTVNPSVLDSVTRQFVNISAHEQRFGHTQATIGPTNPSVPDGLTRQVVDVSAHEQRFGHAQPATGPTNPSVPDGLTRQVVDVSAHEQRFGHAQPAAGPTNPSVPDGLTRKVVDVSAHEQRFGHTQPTVGPVNTSMSDGVTPPELNFSHHEQSLGRIQPIVGHTTALGSSFDGNGIRKIEEDHRGYSREYGHVLAYEGTGRPSATTDGKSSHRDELHASFPSCGAHATTIAAATQSRMGPEGIRATKRTLYEENLTEDFAADLSWVYRRGSGAQSEPSHTRSSDSLSQIAKPCDTERLAVRNTVVATQDKSRPPRREATRKRALEIVPVLTKLPTVYEAQRRISMSEEIQPPPPSSEYSIAPTPRTLSLPYDEAREGEL